MSYDAFAALVMASGASTYRSHLPVSVSRSYRAASVNILRQLPPLVWRPGDPSIQRRMAMTFTAAFLDALFATRDGLNLAISDEDLLDWLPEDACELIMAPPNAARTRMILSRAASPLPVAWGCLLASCRTFVRKCSSRASFRWRCRAHLVGRARNRPTDPATYEAVSETIGVLLDWALRAHDSASTHASASLTLQVQKRARDRPSGSPAGRSTPPKSVR